jgi:periplasmic divalent cation tolerance protein
MIYILWSCKDKEEARNIISALLEKHLIACASIFPVESIYRWKGKVEESKEIKVLLKTVAHHFDPICKYIMEKGSYEVPEISQIDIHKSNPRYLDWIAEET